MAWLDAHQGFCKRRTPPDGYELPPQLLPNLAGSRRAKGLHGAIRVRLRIVGVNHSARTASQVAPMLGLASEVMRQCSDTVVFQDFPCLRR
jgi:hypothetical protein